MKTPLRKSPAFPVKLESLAYGGDAVGLLDGQVVFVPGGAPGDTVEVAVTEDRDTFLRGRLVSIIEPSPERVEPFCPFANRCGGCQWQHIPYDAQLSWKRRIVEESIRRIARLDSPVEPCRPSPDPVRYRTVARFPAGISEGKLQIGYFERKTNVLVDIDSCPVLTARTGELFTKLRTILGEMAPVPPIVEITVQASQNHPSGLAEILLRTSSDISGMCGNLVSGIPGCTGVTARLKDSRGSHRIIGQAGEPARCEEIAGAKFRISGDSFFQVNVLQAEQMVALVREMVREEAAGSCIDGYGGVGLFSFTVFPKEADITLFDIEPHAIGDSRYNAGLNGYARFTALAGGVSEAFARNPRPDLVVLDPPRTGLGRRVVAEIAAHGPRVVVCISCNPATLARDLAVFHEHGYNIERIVPFDMFPQTFHIECVALLREAKRE